MSRAAASPARTARVLARARLVICVDRRRALGSGHGEQWLRVLDELAVDPEDVDHAAGHAGEDLVALDPSESTVLYRGFRDFVGPYVAHCHNLMHEDHAMMFGWTIVP